MFSQNSNNGRSDQHSYSPEIPFRAPDFYVPNIAGTSAGISSASRAYASDYPRADYVGESSNSHPGPPRYASSLYSSREEGTPPSIFTQSYDRSNRSPSDLNAGIPYRDQRDERTQVLLNGMPPLRRPTIPAMLDTYSLGTSQPPIHSEPNSALTAYSDHSGNSEGWPAAVQQLAPQPSKTRKTRREKPRIALAPDQPPTTQGKPRARVYVACLQCRTRKIRCDGAKPVCHNCSRRTTGGPECNYDALPKRRGPDKTPGARQRLARDARNEVENGGLPARRRRRTRNTSTSNAPSTIVQERSPSEGSGSDMLPSLPMPVLLTSPTSADPSHALPHPLPPSSYERTTFSPDCGCHGLSQCPSFLAPDLSSSSAEPRGAQDIMATYDPSFDLASIMPCGVSGSRSYIREVDEEGNEQHDLNAQDISNQPSLNFTRKIWWDSLLSLYLSPNTSRLQPLSSSQRESASQSITSDLRFLFKASNYWFSFFHIPSFFGNFFDPTRRERLQPCLVLALLAMSTFWQSSEVGLGSQGRERALRFRDEAQAALDASVNAGWIDETLAQAAWLLSLFEVCAHPRHSTARSTSALVMLDSIIRSLSLTLVDSDDPNTTMFAPRCVPVVTTSGKTNKPVWFPDQLIGSSMPISSPTSSTDLADKVPGCSCKTMTLGQHWAAVGEHAPLWGPTATWEDAWSEGEIRRESCRRLCWSSIILAAGHISYTTASRDEDLDLFISDPANYALLFSGESLARAPALCSTRSSKNTIWALHDRSFLLWLSCTRMRGDSHATDVDKAQFAVKAWLEADALERALNNHTCELERAFIFQAREYIFNTRMFITYEFQRYIPLVSVNVSGLFHRSKAEEWLSHQASVARRFMLGLHTITGNASNLLARRPFFVFWFMGQISRALSLWKCDNTLTIALDVCKALLPAIDYLTALWPCPEQRHRYEVLRERLVNACYAAGVNPPPPPNLSLALPSSVEALV
ncbi:hypothetical protein BDQ12DRAFT_733873 [Crucibulum laeve]|uniref:Zn(2)-C6 fungal-type domain-containing protein n=1 Tax=Crucibulum laeve TaxID=68775 RepID=A0A5C3M8A7_9AGAR|nr:hypothetical protein BDQ12DRAFT_733873 [Crucibulum laeve]